MMTKMARAFIPRRAASALGCLAGALFLHGADRAQLAGLVEDASSAVLVDVSLTVVNEETGIQRTGRTDEMGTYRIGALAPGVYKVTARKPGFRILARLHVELATDRETRLDFVMRVGSVKEVITVDERHKPVPSGDGAVAVSVGRKLIDELPLGGRGILSLVELAPGTVATPASQGEAGQFSANGQRANTNYFTVDGVSANSGVTGSVMPAQFSGGALPTMTAFGSLDNLAALDALQEVRVETSSFAPQFGRLPGAQVALTTRSGSDQWHGAASYHLRNDHLAANDWFAASRGYGRSPLHMNQWGAGVGGPLERDRTYVFAGWQSLRLRAPFAWLEATPSAASRQTAPISLRPLLAAFPFPNSHDLGGGAAEFLARGSLPSRLDSGSIRIDRALTPQISLFGRYSQAPSMATSGYLPIEQADFRTHSMTLGVSATSGASLINDARLNVSADEVSAAWLPGSVDLRRFLPPVTDPGESLYGVAIGGLGQLVSGENGRNHQGQLQFVDGMALERGPHTLHFGMDYLRLTPARQDSALAVAGMWPSLAALLAGEPIQTAVSRAEQASSLIETLSFYFQDTWQASSRLTLTYGLRWEITPAPSLRQSTIGPGSAVNSDQPYPTTPAGVGGESPGNGRLWPTRFSQLAPRLGAAYRLSDRSALRAGWGIFYDLGFSAATDPINGYPFNRWQFSNFAGVVPSPTVPPQGYTFASNLRLPYSYQGNLTYERAFSPSDVLQVSVVESLGRHLLRRESVAAPYTELAQGAVATNEGASHFQAFEMTYQRRLARGWQGNLNYTWSHSIDNGSWDSAVALVGPRYTSRNDRGGSSFDVRHGFSAVLGYESPGIARNGFGRRLSADWNLQGIVHARSGFPIDVLAHQNSLGFGFDDFPRPDLVPGAPLWIRDASVPSGRRLNPAAFSLPAGTQGNLGRDAIAGFGMFQLDLALRRRFAVSEGASLEVEVDSFNALNHRNAADPVRYLNEPLFGQPVSMLNFMLGNGSPRSGLTPAFQIGSPRSVGIGVKLRF
jgi:hypothetical protein